MFKRYIIFILVLLLAFMTVSCSEDSSDDEITSSNIYEPVSLDVPLILQQQPTWCWLAAAQMVIAYRHYGSSLAQCQMLEIGYNLYPNTCCYNPYQCNTPGTIYNIQNLVAYVGGRYSYITPSADALSLGSILRAGNPVIAFIRSPYASIGHFIVIRGIRYDRSANLAWVLVNDPLSHYPNEVVYSQLYSIWQQSLVVF